MTRRNIYDYFFILLSFFIFYGVIKLLAPFAGALLSALFCALTFYPMYRALHRWFPKLHSNLRAALANGLVFVFFVTPLILLMWATFQESSELAPVLKQGSAAVAQWREGDMTEFLPLRHVRMFVANAYGVQHAQFQEALIGAVDKIVDYVSLTGTLLATHVVLFLVDLLIMLFALFFMFRDGEKLSAYIQELLPLRKHNKDELANRIHDTAVGIVRGLLLTSLIQGIAATLGYLIVGAPAAVLLGALTAFSGLVPVVGTFGVWVPVSLYYLLQGSYLQGTFVALWGLLVVVGLIDSLVRPYLMGKKVALPLYALFFALLGGVEVWGAKGIMLGPLFAGLLPIILDIYRERYVRSTDPAAE